MNKRGVAILLLSSIGFLVAIILFFSTVSRIHVVGNSTFLGQAEVEVLDTYIQGEQLMIFLETSAKQSLKQEKFGDSFSAYLTKANRLFGTDLKIEDYDFDDAQGAFSAICKRQVTLGKGNVHYTVNPSFIVYH